LRDIAATLDISERRAFGIVTDLTTAGYIVKARDGRRNRYEIEHHLPLPDAPVRERTVGELLDVLASATPDTNQVHSSAKALVTSARRDGRWLKQIT
jgi:hypothetical protein